ncbi:MAG: PDZ domain-containing protein, partial [Pirellulaceae bacterium]
MIRCIPLFTLAALLFAFSPAHAQNSLQDFQKKVDDAMPKGRLIKKWRDELRGSKKEDEQKKEAAKKAAESEREQAGSRRPTLANQNSRATNDDRGQSEPQLPEQYSFRQPQPPMSSAPRTAMPSTQRPQTPEFIDPRGRPSTKRTSATKTDPNKPVGFGLLLDEKKAELVAVEVEPTGNAYAAGIRRGDVIKKLGGVTITTVAEFDEVAGVMKNGDQIEFSVSRKGKTDTFPVTFGQLDPEEVAAATENSE